MQERVQGQRLTHESLTVESAGGGAILRADEGAGAQNEQTDNSQRQDASAGRQGQ